MLASHFDLSVRRPLLWCPALLAALVSLATVGSAFAVVDVLNETWTRETTVPGRHVVDFTANLSPNDLARGVHFSIALREADALPRALVRFATSAVPYLPDAGATVIFRATFDLDCDATTGVVRGIPVEASARFCVPGSGHQWNPLPGTPHADSTTVSGAFGLAVLDENDAVGSNPTPVDAFLCEGGTVPAALSFAAPAAPSLPAPILDSETAATIGIYFDPEGTRCEGTITPGGIDTVYVLAKLGSNDDSYCGIFGAEFRFAGIPPSWHSLSVANPALLGIGDPFTEGVTVVSSQCLRPANGVVLLYTVLVFAGAVVPDVTFNIEGREPPTNLLFPCPLVLACDEPIFTKICVVAEPCFVNPTVPRKCDTSTAVMPTTWSVLKQLYR